MKSLMAVALALVAPATGVLSGAEAAPAQCTTDAVADAPQEVLINAAAGAADAAPVGAEVRVVPDTVTQQEVPAVDVSASEAVSSIPELTPTTITMLADDSEAVTRSWAIPEGQRVTQIVSEPASLPTAAPSPSPVAAFSPDASMSVPETVDRPSTEESSTTDKRPLREHPASDSALIAIGLAAFILMALAGSSWLMRLAGGVKRS